jgi:hypothetical protein
MANSDKVAVSKIVESAMSSGLIDRKATLEDVVKQFGSDLDQVAGYVAAWDRYVLVVSANIKEEVIIKR